MKIVEVKWNDTMNTKGWMDNDYIPKKDNMVHRSIGYLKHRDKNRVVICQSYGEHYSAEILQIPAGCVKSVRVIRR